MRVSKNLFLFINLILVSSTFADDGWEILFNGRDLSGWRGTLDDESFTVVDGTIRANATGNQLNHLYYVGDRKEGYVPFKNFELELWARGEASSNSGIYFHTDTTPRNSRFMLKNGYEVQLNSSREEKRKTGSLYSVVDLEKSIIDESKWFSISIVVVNKQITVKINGEKILDYTQPDEPKRIKGHEGKMIMPEGGAIALQAHDKKSVFFFRDIRVKRLP